MFVAVGRQRSQKAWSCRIASNTTCCSREPVLRRSTLLVELIHPAFSPTWFTSPMTVIICWRIAGLKSELRALQRAVVLSTGRGMATGRSPGWLESVKHCFFHEFIAGRRVFAMLGSGAVNTRPRMFAQRASVQWNGSCRAVMRQTGMWPHRQARLSVRVGFVSSTLQRETL